MWVFIEGIDRSGKSTIVEEYRKNGYQSYHFIAPNKKYANPGYAGPSYMDEVMSLYMAYDGKDVVFDRSIYGEQVWPFVYGREPQLSEEDFEYLQEFELKNSSQYIFMYDENKAAHWKRCVDNNEPLDKSQFELANAMFEDKLVSLGTFLPMTLPKFMENKSTFIKVTPKEELKKTEPVSITTPDTPAEINITQEIDMGDKPKLSEHQLRLEKANAINSLLSSKLIKKQGQVFDELENDIRGFLQNKLGNLFNATSEETLSAEEVSVLKLYVKRIMEKSKEIK